MTPRQDQFCIEIARGDCSATTAAKRAGYSEKTAGIQACKLLKKVYVKARIAALRAEAERGAIADLREVCEGLTQIFRGNATDFMPYLGKPDELQAASNQKAIASVEVSHGKITKLRLRDPAGAARDLAKYLGWDQGPPPDRDAERQALEDFAAQARIATGLPPQQDTPEATPREGSTP